MTELVSFRKYARHRGVAVSYISKLVAQGRIPLAEDRKIDVEAADAAMESNVPHSCKGERGKPPAPPLRKGKSTHERGQAVYGVELARLTRAKADAAELELAAQRGALVNRADYERESQAFDEALKQRLLALPTKLAVHLANQPPAKVYAALEREVHELLNEFAHLPEATQ